MSECKLDHSKEDVLKKLSEQSTFLPEALHHSLFQFLHNRDLEQTQLNEIFHLLKKYDLASKEDQAERIKQLDMFLTS